MSHCAMQRRQSGHKHEIREKNTPLGRYFSQCGYTNFSLQIMDCEKEWEEN